MSERERIKAAFLREQRRLTAELEVSKRKMDRELMALEDKEEQAVSQFHPPYNPTSGSAEYDPHANQLYRSKKLGKGKPKVEPKVEPKGKSRWIEHVKKYALENGVSYKEAMSSARSSYK